MLREIATVQRREFHCSRRARVAPVEHFYLNAETSVTAPNGMHRCSRNTYT